MQDKENVNFVAKITFTKITAAQIFGKSKRIKNPATLLEIFLPTHK